MKLSDQEKKRQEDFQIKREKRSIGQKLAVLARKNNAFKKREYVKSALNNFIARCFHIEQKTTTPHKCPFTVATMGVGAAKVCYCCSACKEKCRGDVLGKDFELEECAEPYGYLEKSEKSEKSESVSFTNSELRKGRQRV